MKRKRCLLILSFLFIISCVGSLKNDSDTLAGEEESIKKYAQAKGIYVGTAVRYTPLFHPAETNYKKLLTKEFNIIVAEDDMKFENLQTSENNFFFNYADRITAFAKSNGMKVRGHTLLWHNQSGFAANITDPTQASNVLSNHIFTVMRRYSNVVEYWDVVNEAIGSDTNLIGYPNSLRKSFWWTNLGEAYVEYAFQLARAAVPNAKLFYNEYGNEGVSRYKFRETINLVSNLKAKGLIDGLGLQMHLSTDRNYPFDDNFFLALEEYAKLGVEIHITELDIAIRLTNTNGIALTPEELEIEYEKQAQMYALTFATCLSNTNVKAILMWGFTDKYSWIPQYRINYGDALIFDKNYNKKKAYKAILEILKK